MKRTLLAGLAGLSGVVLMAAVVEARAMMIAPAPVAMRVATAEVIVVGKVTGFGDKMEAGERFPGTKQEYQVATVKVQDVLKGGKAKEVRVGFIPPGAGPGGPGIRPGIRRPAGVNLAIGQEYCLFLSKPAKGDFYIAPMYYDVINKTAPTFANDVAEVKRCAKLLADPKAGLQAKKKDDRFLTAAMLITRYRARPFVPGGQPKEVPIDADQSKLILKVLADADWNVRPGIMARMSPQMMFNQLGLTKNDGWTQPRDYREFPEAAKKWLKANAGKYRIKRFAAPKEDKKD